MAQGIKNGLFQIFLFFFYNQVLGLDPFITGVALTIALTFDSVSDPLIGAISDHWKSEKWGRRHPFMFASAIPLGITLYLLFLPPIGINETGLFLWLTFFSILVRLSLTLFVVPAMSLGAEMSTNYIERTSITTYRVTFSSFISPIIIFIGFSTFFTSTPEFSNGMFNVEAYPKFALLAGFLAVIAILLSTYFTRGIIPKLPIWKGDDKMSIKSVFNTIKQATSLSSYRSLIIYIFIFYIAIGIGIIFSPYYITYFFALNEKQFGLMLLTSAPAGIIAFFLGPLLSRKWDKKNILICTSMLTGFFFSSPYNLRFAGFFPENDSSFLLWPLFILTCLGYTFLWISISVSHSMMADIIDEYELNYGIRNEGLFFSTLLFANKATTGLGSLFAGILLKIFEFPEQTDVQDISVNAIMGLGWVGGPIVLFIYLLSIFSLLFYSLSRERYDTIRIELDKRYEENLKV